MLQSELNSMTVLQLRKLAKEKGITLGTGLDKAAVIDRIAKALEEAGDSAAEDIREESAEDATPAEGETASDTAQPKYQAAWHSPDAPRFNSRPSYQIPGTAGRSAWQNTTPSGRPLTPEQRVQPTRPNTFTPRFGPAAVSPSTPASEPQHTESETPAQEPVRFQPVSPLPERRVGFSGNGSFGPKAAAAYPGPGSGELFSAAGPQDSGANTPTLEELLASGDYEEGGGILELHPDGYGFLRAANFMPSSRDIYVSMAQIRRFALRTGDQIQGKVRPQREGDKYAALLYIDSVNGLPESEAFSRPVFDELTPVYPSRKMSLEPGHGVSVPDVRLIDLIAPLGFGQRALLMCPPDTGKRELLANYAKVITANYPDITVLMLMIDMNPEDITMLRDSVPCSVLASTFDQSPESHLRLSEMVMERAMRLVEQKKDVVILADSLTKLAKIYTTAAVQQGRSVPGMVNPASLLRAKKLFGSARACKEGGSLTVIAAMDIATGSKVDDSVVEEFKGTANMELVLDQSVARAGVRPAVNLQKSYTKNSDILLDEEQKEGLNEIRKLLGTTPSSIAIPQLISMMDKAETNGDLLMKVKGWINLMNR